jgi:hypothetical protein
VETVTTRGSPHPPGLRRTLLTSPPGLLGPDLLKKIGEPGPSEWLRVIESIPTRAPAAEYALRHYPGRSGARAPLGVPRHRRKMAQPIALFWLQARRARQLRGPTLVRGPRTTLWSKGAALSPRPGAESTRP